MSTMRKIIIPLLLFIYLIGSGIIPPLMGIWNKEVPVRHPLLLRRLLVCQCAAGFIDAVPLLV